MGCAKSNISTYFFIFFHIFNIRVLVFLHIFDIFLHIFNLFLHIFGLFLHIFNLSSYIRLIPSYFRLIPSNFSTYSSYFLILLHFSHIFLASKNKKKKKERLFSTYLFFHIYHTFLHILKF